MTNFSVSLDKSPIVTSETPKSSMLQWVAASRSRPIPHGFQLDWFSWNSLVSNDVTYDQKKKNKEMMWPKYSIELWPKAHLDLLTNNWLVLKMAKVVCKCSKCSSLELLYIIISSKKYQYELPQRRFKNVIHQTLKGGRSIGEAKWHHNSQGTHNDPHES